MYVHKMLVDFTPRHSLNFSLNEDILSVEFCTGHFIMSDVVTGD